MNWQTWLDRARDHISRYRSLCHLSETKILVGLSLLSGVAAGLAAFVFERLLQYIRQISFGRFSMTESLQERWWILLLPPVGGGLAGFLIKKFSQEARGQGVAEVIYALRRADGKIPAATVLTKAVSSALTIGTGGSAGPEGPVIQIGGGVGSVIGQILNLPPSMLRVLVAAGAAGGLAAVFNAPIAGVLFAMEVLLRDFVVDAFSLVVLASVAGSVTSHLLVGNETFLQVPPFSMGSNWELLAFSLMGIFIAPISRLFVKLITAVELWFDRHSRWPDSIKPAVGGLGVGLLGLIFPPVLGTGLEVMTETVRGQAPAGHHALDIGMALLLIVKMFATAFTLGSGGSGGLLTPSFFCGAMAGGAFAAAVDRFLPIGSYGSFSLIGMGAFFAAMSRAPLTAIILLFEVTHDQNVILPAMLACVMATLTAQRLHPQSYEVMRLAKRGLYEEELESGGI